jgi:hypothetical protein
MELSDGSSAGLNQLLDLLREIREGVVAKRIPMKEAFMLFRELRKDDIAGGLSPDKVIGILKDFNKRYQLFLD